MTLTVTNVLSKKAIAGDDTIFDCEVTFTGHQGNPEPETHHYGWRRGDPHGLGPQIDAWMDAHPDFPVQEADPVTHAAEPTPAERFAAATGLSIEDLRALVKE